MDSELGGREPAEGSHREVVRAAIVNGKLLCEIIQRIESVAGVKTFLILAVAALDLAVVARGIRANALVANAQLSGSLFKQRR